MTEEAAPFTTAAPGHVTFADRHKWALSSDGVYSRGGKTISYYAGKLDAAHQSGLIRLETQLIQIPDAANGYSAIVSARAEFTWGGVFTGLGDADPNNAGAQAAPHLIRMAETRAKARALADAVNIASELADDDGRVEGGTPAPPHKPQRPAAPTPKRIVPDANIPPDKPPAKPKPSRPPLSDDPKRADLPDSIYLYYALPRVENEEEEFVRVAGVVDKVRAWAKQLPDPANNTPPLDDGSYAQLVAMMDGFGFPEAVWANSLRCIFGSYKQDQITYAIFAATCEWFDVGVDSPPDVRTAFIHDVLRVSRWSWRHGGAFFPPTKSGSANNPSI